MKAFNGDTFALEHFEKLKKDLGLKVVIETGTYHGDTTKHLAEIFPEVHTIELNQEYQNIAKNNVGDLENVSYHLGSSPEVMEQIIPEGWNPGLLIFLDAHWNDYNPLLDELKVIANKKIKPVIVIHDFKVPGKDFGFDSYAGQDYDYDWIKGLLGEIYGNEYDFYYNEEATGSQRGIIYILPR